MMVAKMSLLVLIQILAATILSVSGCTRNGTKISAGLPLFSTVQETTKAGTIFTTLGVDETSVKEFNGTILHIFSNKSVLLKSEIDFSEGGSLEAQTECSGSSLKVIFSVIDHDNHAPEWEPSDVYTVEIQETHPVNTSIFTASSVKPKSTDKKDSSDVQIIYNVILPGTHSSYFSVLSNRTQEMTLILMKSLDYEKEQTFNITLQAQDYETKNNTFLWATNATLVIKVLDVDDLPPEWKNCSKITTMCVYEADIFDNTTKGTVMSAKPVARDGDIFINAAIEYKLIAQTPSDIVGLNTTTWELFLLDHNPKAGKYTIKMQANEVDKSDKKSEIAEVVLTVFPSTYVPPYFSSAIQKETVQENVDTWTTTVTAIAQVEPVVYKVETHNDTFRVDTTGKISLLKALDFEHRNFYNITISANDGRSKGYILVQVNVTNVNEHNPVFDKTSYIFTPKTREKGMVLGQVKASDGDGDSIQFSIQAAGDKRYFKVHEQTGVVTVEAESNELVEKDYSFTVVASDSSRQNSVTVAVSFPGALGTTNIATASTSLIPLIVVGCVFGVIILVVIIAFILYKRRSDKEVERAMSMVSGPAFSNSLYYGGSYDGDGGATSLQDNPIEGFDPYDHEAEEGAMTRDREINEIYLQEGLVGETTDYSSMFNGSIRTLSSAAGSQRTLVNGSTTRKLHTGSNLEVVQVENAVDTSSVADGSETGRGLTVYL